MNMGLEQRLRSVSGVAGLRIDLGKDGLEGIHVSIDEGTDEGVILEEIRRILVAYGLRSRPGGVLEGTDSAPLPDKVWLGEREGRAAARLTYGSRVVEGFGDLSWDGAADAVLAAVASYAGFGVPDRINTSRQRLGDRDIVVVLLGANTSRTASVAIADSGLADALVRAVTGALSDLAGELPTIDIVDR